MHHCEITLVWSIETFILLAAAVIAEGLVDLEFYRGMLKT